MTENPKRVFVYRNEVVALEKILRAARLVSDAAEALGGGPGTDFVLACDEVQYLLDRSRVEYGLVEPVVSVVSR